MVMSAPSAFTREKRIADLSTGRRTQPCEALRPQADFVKPWMAKPGAKKIELGIDACSYSSEWWSLSIHSTLNLPAGVSYPFFPDETFQS